MVPVMWQQTKIAREFFEENIPFAEMSAANSLVSGDDDYVFAKENIEFGHGYNSRT